MDVMNVSSQNAVRTRGKDYITDDSGNIFEVVDKKEHGTLGQDAFLKILLTQMQMQDPLNPMNDNEFINQMTSFSILEQLTQIASKIDNLSKILVDESDTNTDTGAESDKETDTSTEQNKEVGKGIGVNTYKENAATF